MAKQQGSEAEREQREAEERSSPRGKVVYEAVLKEGREELRRASAALFWSGLAAGLSMGFSLIAEGLLRAHLPVAAWQPLVVRLGYSVGFLFVILGRQQLFTENTITPILPLIQQRDAATLCNVLRLWGVVLFANLLGGMILAWVLARTSAFEPEVRAQFTALGREALQPNFGTVVLRGVFAGWLLALMVWLLPFAETGRVGVIILVTYLVGLGQFAHVIVGSIAVFTAAADGAVSWGAAWGNFVLPALIGNVLGGVTLVAALNHAQVVGAETEEGG